MPSVWGAIAFGKEQPRSIEINIHNAGPGLALDVRAARIELREADPTVSWLRRKLRRSELQEVALDPTPRVRTLAAAEGPSDWFTVGVQPAEDFSEPFWVAIRYRDTAEREWELTVPPQAHEPSKAPIRLQAGRRRERFMFWLPSAHDW